MKIETLILSTAALAATTTAAKAAPDINQVKSDLQSAICLQDWDKAMEQASVLMAMPSITPEHRQSLVDWRHRFSDYAVQQTRFETLPGCSRTNLPIEVKGFENNQPRSDFNWRAETARIQQSSPSIQPRFSTPSASSYASYGSQADRFYEVNQRTSNSYQTSDQVKSDLHIAICTQDWHGAIEKASILMAMSDITAEHRQSLVSWRQNFENYAAAGTKFENLPNCGGVTVQD